MKRYVRASKKEKGVMLDELCELTGWTRRHARRAVVVSSSVVTVSSITERSRPPIASSKT